MSDGELPLSSAVLLKIVFAWVSLSSSRLNCRIDDHHPLPPAPNHRRGYAVFEQADALMLSGEQRLVVIPVNASKSCGGWRFALSAAAVRGMPRTHC